MATKPIPANPQQPQHATGSFRPANAPAGGASQTPQVPMAPKPARGATPGTVTLTRGQFIGSLATAALVGAGIVWGGTSIVGCATKPTEQESDDTEEPEVWKSRYDWSGLSTLENGFFAYSEGDQKLSEAGVDVSELDGEIDWASVKAAGADFAMIRLGRRGYSEGAIFLDNYFLANISGAAAAGLKVGVYFFSQAVTAQEAREEANYVVETLASTNVALSYPVAFDEEPITNGDVARTDDITSAQLTENAVTFCQTIENAGYTPMLYGNQHDLAKLDLTGRLSAYEVWYAEYDVSEPSAQVDFGMWQYSATGTVPGMDAVTGQCDMNIRFLTA